MLKLGRWLRRQQDRYCGASGERRPLVGNYSNRKSVTMAPSPSYRSSPSIPMSKTEQAASISTASSGYILGRGGPSVRIRLAR